MIDGLIEVQVRVVGDELGKTLIEMSKAPRERAYPHYLSLKRVLAPFLFLDCYVYPKIPLSIVGRVSRRGKGDRLLFIGL